MEKHLLNSYDLYKIISDAKKNITNMNLPLYISRKEVKQCDLVSIAIIESILMHLNSKKLLTKQISLDYTNPTCDYEIED